MLIDALRSHSVAPDIEDSFCQAIPSINLCCDSAFAIAEVNALPELKVAERESLLPVAVPIPLPVMVGSVYFQSVSILGLVMSIHTLKNSALSS